MSGMRRVWILAGVLIFLGACQPDTGDIYVPDSGEVYVLGNSWSVDAALPSSRIFPALLHRYGIRVVHLGIAGESADQALLRLSGLSYPMPALLIIEAEGYIALSGKDQPDFLLQLRALFPEVPFWMLYVDKVPEAHKRLGKGLGSITWVDLHKVREEWSGDRVLPGNARFHQYLAAYLSDRLSVR